MELNVPRAQGPLFQPSDSELIKNFLMLKLLERPNPDDPVITIPDGLHIVPEKLVQRIDKHQGPQEGRRFFYTTRTRDDSYDTRPQQGKWGIIIQKDQEVADDKRVVGYKRKLMFFHGEGKRVARTPTDWCIHEFRVSSAVFRAQSETIHTVLCVLFKDPAKLDNLPVETGESSRGSGSADDLPGTAASSGRL